jgi:hypothetical protein
MRKQRPNQPDDSLAAWQEWMRHTPGSWRSSGRVPPTGRAGRRPTRAGYALVALGAALALWSVAGLALTVGRGLVQRIPTRLIRRLTGAVLAGLAVLTLVEAVRG